jgi:hypothetical protein
MNATDRYKARAEEWNRRRPTVIIKVSTGAEFKVRKFDAVEIVKVFEALGVPMDQLDSITTENLGQKILAHMDDVLNKVIVPMTVSPKLVPSGQAPIHVDELSVDDLEVMDRADLVKQLLIMSQGGDGKALAESFRPEPSRPPRAGPKP